MDYAPFELSFLGFDNIPLVLLLLTLLFQSPSLISHPLPIPLIVGFLKIHYFVTHFILFLLDLSLTYMVLTTRTLMLIIPTFICSSSFATNIEICGFNCLLDISTFFST